MKSSLAFIAIACALSLPACSRKAADNATVEQQVQERLAQEHQAEQQRALHEREAALDERERLLNEREQMAEAATPPSSPVAAAPQVASPAAVQPAAPNPDGTYQTFYEDLSAYGTWVEMAGYGYVWQPLAGAQDPRWRPYTIGHWVFTDDGWTWMSAEPFGWITYHYGRWMRTRTLGWVWFPGEQWAPAWVSWRYGNGYVGWAPLPPEARFDGSAGIQQWADQQFNLGASDYVFIPESEFGDDSMAGVEVPPGQDEGIYDTSNNITDIYYEGGVIYCYGPNYDFMRSRSHRPLGPRLALMREGYQAGGQNGSAITGTTFQITAPRITRSQTAPRTLRGRVTDTRITVTAPPTQSSAPITSIPQEPNQPARTITGAPPAGMHYPSQMRPVPVPEPNTGGGNAGGETGLPRVPSRARVLSDSEDQQPQASESARQQQLAEAEAQRQQAVRAAQEQQANQLRAEEAARAERVAAERAATEKAGAERAAAEAAARESSARAAAPATAPTGPQGNAPQPRNQ